MKDIFTILSLVVILIIAIIASGVTSAGALNNGKVINSAKADITLSETTEDLSLESYGIKWTPDSHLTYISFPNGERRYFISGNQKTYYMDTSVSTTFSEAIKAKTPVKESFGPDVNVAHRNGYSTIGSVLQTDKSNPNHVIGFTQNEQQAINPDGTLNYSNFTTSIGLLESTDAGQTWTDYGPVIRGDDYLEPGTKISGAGHPSALIVGDYVYIYYANWASQTLVFHADQIYLARAKILPNGSVANFEFYKEGGFSAGEDNLKSVIEANAIENGKYSALPSISYNIALRKYLAFYETDRGFAVAFSQNGTSWSRNKLIFYFTKPMSQRQEGDLWNSYPSLLSDKTEPNDQTTSAEGNLYYSQGVWPNTAHQLTKKGFSF